MENITNIHIYACIFIIFSINEEKNYFEKEINHMYITYD